MAAAKVHTQPTHPHFSAGSRSTPRQDSGYASPLSRSNTASLVNPLTGNKNSSNTSGYPSPNGSAEEQKSARQNQLRSTLRNIDTSMLSSSAGIPGTSSPASAGPLPVRSKRSGSLHSSHLKHRRGSSASSLRSSPALPSTQVQYDAFPEFAPYDPPAATTSTSESRTPRLKPYLRKFSSGRDGGGDAEQGRLDLSKSVSETTAGAGRGFHTSESLGLGIHEMPSRSTSALDSGFPAIRAGHKRNMSGTSQVSIASSRGGGQHFVHPMRPTPTRPYTPVTDAGSGFEAEEADDIVEEDVQPSQHIYASSRSISSTPIQTSTSNPLFAASSLQQQHSTPLSLARAHTTSDYTPINPQSQPQRLTSRSQSNLSTHSARSSSLRFPLPFASSRSRAETSRSVETFTSLCSRPQCSRPQSRRTSIDRAMSSLSLSRRSEAETGAQSQSRDDRIREARRKFEAKEAGKERLALERRESELAKSAKKEAIRRAPRAESGTGGSEKTRPKISRLGSSGLRLESALSVHGDEKAAPDASRCSGDGSRSKDAGRSRQSSRLGIWFQTRVLGCGRRRD